MGDIRNQIITFKKLVIILLLFNILLLCGGITSQLLMIKHIDSQAKSLAQVRVVSVLKEWKKDFKDKSNNN